MKEKPGLILLIVIAIMTAGFLSLLIAYSDSFPFLENYHLYLFLVYLVVGLVAKVPSQVSISVGLILLMVTPVIGLHSGGALAGQWVLYAYYFLSIGLLWAIAGCIRERQKTSRAKTGSPGRPTAGGAKSTGV